MEVDSHVHDTPVVVKGFTVVGVKTSADKPSHYIYVQDNNGRDHKTSHPKSRTLFVINIPPYFNEECLSQLFKQCGKVVRVEMTAKDTGNDCSKHFPPISTTTDGYKSAYLIFKNHTGVKNACNLPYSKPLVMNNLHQMAVTGLTKWCNDYAAQRVNMKELQSEVDDYMAKFDAKQQQELEAAKAQEGMADDDGWITVSRVGKKKAAPRTENRKKHLLKQDTKRRKEKELLNFYAFQLNDSKKDRISTLRQQFEEDKQKIATMKAQRKFRPY